jgi:hypothetical protein
MVNEPRYDVKFFTKKVDGNKVTIVTYALRNEVVIYGYFAFEYVLEKGPAKDYEIDLVEDDAKLRQALIEAVKRFEALALEGIIGKHVVRAVVREIDIEEMSA